MKSKLQSKTHDVYEPLVCHLSHFLSDDLILRNGEGITEIVYFSTPSLGFLKLVLL